MERQSSIALQTSQATPGEDDPTRLFEALTLKQQRQAMRFMRILAEDDTEAA
jgi:hypothetical protein